MHYFWPWCFCPSVLLSLSFCSFRSILVYFSTMVYFDCLYFLSLQLPARQEPSADSSKYTAADVRIVSILTIVLIIWFLPHFVIFQSQRNKLKMTKDTGLPRIIEFLTNIKRKVRAVQFDTWHVARKIDLELLDTSKTIWLLRLVYLSQNFSCNVKLLKYPSNPVWNMHI